MEDALQTTDPQGLTPDEREALDHLEHREKIFVLKYLRCYREDDAAREAGYKEGMGARLLIRKGVRAALKAFLAGRVMGVTEMLARLSEHARADMTDVLTDIPLLDEEGKQVVDRDGEKVFTTVIDPMKAVRNGKGYLLKTVQQTKDGIKVQMVDSQFALDLLMKASGAATGRQRAEDAAAWKNVFEEAEDADYEIITPETDPAKAP